ncbi:MAG: response regulator transcription factor [Sphingobacteriales bacterium]|nr:MAG: response regulator transcription factor [Sphingobacteriales bacterium]
MNNYSKIRTIIIDDEEGGRNTLKNLLTEFCPEVDVVGLADSAESGFKIIQQLQPELVFLDVRMPRSDEGFQLLESLTEINFALIFTTAYDEYAIRAIKFSALDYLLKPIDILELQKAVNRYIQRRGTSDRQAVKMLSNSGKTKPFTKLGLPSAEEVTFVNIDDIIRCEADGNCTVFFLNNHQKILVTKTLKYYETLLEELGFYRIHDSHLVNLRHIRKYYKEGVVEMSDGSKAFVSARKKKGFLDKLQN